MSFEHRIKLYTKNAEDVKSFKLLFKVKKIRRAQMTDIVMVKQIMSKSFSFVLQKKNECELSR